MTATAWPPPTERLERVRAFMNDRVLPNEHVLDREDNEADALVAKLRDEVRDAGLWAPHVPPEAGGTGTGFLDYAYLNEHIGRTHWRSEEHTSELQSPYVISYAVFCLKKK